MAYELYHLLELSPQASSEEIEKSIYVLVRKYSKQKNPEKLQSIRDAYEILNNLKTKQDYDSLQQYGGQIADLVNKAEAKMSAEDWIAAIPLLKRVVVLLPQNNAALEYLVICFARSKDWNNAFTICRKLIENNLDNPSHWSMYGTISRQYAESFTNQDIEKKKAYQQAREHFKKAIELEPYNSEPYLEIARTYTSENDYDRALSWSEQAINADGKTDYQDFETLFYICTIHVFSGEFERINSVAERIISLLPKEYGDVHKYVAAKFYNSGLELYQIGCSNNNIVLLRAASLFFKSAKKFDPNDEDTIRLNLTVENLVQAYDLVVSESLEKDSQISTGFSILAGFYLSLALNQEVENQDEIFSRIIDVIFNNNPASIISSIRRIKSHYTPIYKLNESFFDKTLELMQSSVQEAAQKKSSPVGFFESIGKFFGS
jgi:tetratricopeptide (TPR) repeat protein